MWYYMYLHIRMHTNHRQKCQSPSITIGNQYTHYRAIGLSTELILQRIICRRVGTAYFFAEIA